MEIYRYTGNIAHPYFFLRHFLYHNNLEGHKLSWQNAVKVSSLSQIYIHFVLIFERLACYYNINGKVTKFEVTYRSAHVTLCIEHVLLFLFVLQCYTSHYNKR